MKKLICLLMMCWLPLSVTVANAMSAHMMLNQLNSKTHHASATVADQSIANIMPCHQTMQSDDHQATQTNVCVDCTACELATAFATIDVVNHLTTPKKIAEKFTITQSSLISIQLPPSTKPPILH